MVFAIGIVTLVVILLILFLWSNRKYYVFACKMPGPWGLPFLGIVHKIYKTEDILYVLPEICRSYNSKTIFGWVGTYPALFTFDPKIIQTILNSPDCINKSPLMYETFKESFGDGIFTSRTPSWNIHRKLLNPSFRHKVLLDRYGNSNKLSLELCDQFDQCIGAGAVNMKKLLDTMSLKASIASTFGTHFNDEPFLTKLLHCYETILAVGVQRATKPWLNHKFILSKTRMYKPFMEAGSHIQSFINNQVVTRINTLEQQKLHQTQDSSRSVEDSVNIEKPRQLFIDEILNIHKRNEFTFEDVCVECSGMVFGAFETTASTLFSILMCLAMHPQCQEQVFEELVTLYPDKDFQVQHEDLKSLTYLERCINEALRVVTTAPIIIRECTNDVPISENLSIPKGTQLVLNIFGMHRDEDIWGPTATAFNPDHFLPTNLSDKHSYSYIPFAKGPRMCIGWQYAGMLMKVTLAQVLRRYRFSTSLRFEELKFVESFTLGYMTLPLFEVHRR